MAVDAVAPALWPTNSELAPHERPPQGCPHHRAATQSRPHATFVGVIAASTALQRPLGLTTATRLLGLRVAPALCGLAAVGGASVAAVRAASAVADRATGDDAAAWRRRRARCAEPGLCAAGAALCAAGAAASGR